MGVKGVNEMKEKTKLYSAHSLLFSKVDDYLVEERKRRRELQRSNAVHDKITNQETTEKILRKLDKQINLARILTKDLRFEQLIYGRTNCR